MTIRSQPPSDDRPCARFEERLPAWLEGQLEETECSVMDQHHESCIACAMLVADLDGIVESARSLPVLTPSRDLWSGIETRLAAPVIPLAARHDVVAPAQPARRTGTSIRWFAMAATLLAAVSSGLTWTVARARFSAPTAVSPSVPAVASGSTSASTPSPDASVAAVVPSRSSRSPSAPPAASGEPAPAVASARRPSAVARDGGSRPQGTALIRTAGSMREVDAIYEQEIAALRHIVDQRFAELDSATVSALRRNLETIDQAIEDSRRALERDPRSGLLSTELDRILEAKLTLMRRVALL
jgi:hypothetical protein